MVRFECKEWKISGVVKKTVYLPPELAEAAEEIAREEGKAFSGVVQEALRLLKSKKFSEEFRRLQTYWSRKAMEKDVFSEEDLERYLNS